MAMPIRNVLPVIAGPGRKVGVGTISMTLAKMAESGGMTKLATAPADDLPEDRPDDQRRKERNPELPMVMTLSSRAPYSR